MSQLSTLLGQLNLDIKEVHALSTNDGYFLDIFIVVGWDHKVSLSKSLHLANTWYETLCSCVARVPFTRKNIKFFMMKPFQYLSLF